MQLDGSPLLYILYVQLCELYNVHHITCDCQAERERLWKGAESVICLKLVILSLYVDSVCFSQKASVLFPVTLCNGSAVRWKRGWFWNGLQVLGEIFSQSEAYLI